MNFVLHKYKSFQNFECLTKVTVLVRTLYEYLKKQKYYIPSEFKYVQISYEYFTKSFRKFVSLNQNVCIKR